MAESFNVEAARTAGYSDDEILSHLTQTRKFDVDGAVKSGYSKPDIITHLSSSAPKASVPTPDEVKAHFANYAPAQGPTTPPSNWELAKQAVVGAGKFLADPMGISHGSGLQITGADEHGEPMYGVGGAPTGPLAPRGPAQEFGATMASAPGVAQGAVGIGKTLVGAAPAISRTLRGVAKGATEAPASPTGAAVGGMMGGSVGYLADGPRGAAMGSTIGSSVGGIGPKVSGAIRGGVKAYRNLPEQPINPAGGARGPSLPVTGSNRPPDAPPRPTAGPPTQTGSNNRTPLPAPPVTAAPPAQQGSNAPPIPPPRPQVAPPAERGSNAPPVPPRRQAGPPAQQGSNNRTPPLAATAEAGPPIPPIPPEPTPQAGPPTPPAVEPQAGPPQPPKPQGGAETPPPNTITTGAGRSAYDNAPGKFQTTEEVARFAQANGVPYEEAAKGFAQAGNKVLDRGGLFREIHDPRINTMGHPEISAAFKKMFPGVQSMREATPAQLARFHREVVLPNAMGEFAKGGVIVPAGKEKVRGMAHRWGPKGRKQ